MSNILVFLGIFIAGGAIGFAIYHISLGKKKASKQQQELAQNKAELEQYKAKVNDHFMNSANLMQGVASSYQALHNHMASQSQSLLNDDDTVRFPLLNEIPQKSQEKEALTNNVDDTEESMPLVKENTPQDADTSVEASTNDAPASDVNNEAANSQEKPLDTLEKAAHANEDTVDGIDNTLDASDKKGGASAPPEEKK
jgi:hypothetical protein